MPEVEAVEAELIRRAIESRLADVQISMPGIVESYDPATQRATVIPGLRRPIYDTDDNLVDEEIPPLPNVPVCFPRSSKLSLHFGLQKGDFVHLVFQTWSPAEWRASGAVSTPGELRMHGFHAVAYPGYYPDTAPATDTDESIGVPGSHTSRVHFKSATVEVGDDASKMDFAAVASAIVSELNAIKATLLTGVAATGGPVTFGTPYPGPSGDLAFTNLKALKP